MNFIGQSLLYKFFKLFVIYDSSVGLNLYLVDTVSETKAYLAVCTFVVYALRP